MHPEYTATIAFRFVTKYTIFWCSYRRIRRVVATPEGTKDCDVKPRLLLSIVLLAATGAAAQTTGYVTDQISVTLRTGTSTKHEILRMVPTGTRLTVLEQDPESGYSRVQLPDGTEGWMLNRYVDDGPTARIRLEGAERQLTELKKRAARLQAQIVELSETRGTAEQQLAKLRENNASLAQELAEIRRVSSDAVEISERNRRLSQRISAMETDIQVLRQQNESLRDRSNRDWFVVGAVVVIGSMLFGIGLTRIRWRRRSEWSEL